MLINQKLKELQIDAYLVYDFRGSNHVGREIAHFHKTTTRRFCIIYFQNGKSIYLIPELEKDLFTDLQGTKITYRTYAEFHKELKKYLSPVKVLALDYVTKNAQPLLDLVPQGFIELIHKLNPSLKIVSATDLSQSIGAVWGKQGYKSHKKASAVLTKIFPKVFKFIKNNLQKNNTFSDYDVMEYALEEQKKAGLECDDQVCIVATNKRTTDAHYYPKKGKGHIIKENSLLLLDMWAKIPGKTNIYTDMTQLAWIGPHQVDPLINKIWQNYQKVISEALVYIQRNIQSGLAGYKVDRFIQNKFKMLGYEKYLIHRSGHSLGIYEHGNGANLDDFETKDTRLLIPDTGFTIEPGIYTPDYGIRSEFDLYVHQDWQVEITTPLQEELFLI